MLVSKSLKNKNKWLEKITEVARKVDESRKQISLMKLGTRLFGRKLMVFWQNQTLLE